MRKIGLLLVCATLLCACAPAPTEDTGMLERYVRAGLPEPSGETQRIYYAQRGRLTRESPRDLVTIFSDGYAGGDIETDVYMAAEISHSEQGNELLGIQLGRFDKFDLQIGTLALQDVDDDALDEIIVHIQVARNGGTVTRVYEVENGAIVLRDDLSDYDPGFTYRALPGYRMELVHGPTDYSYIWDIRDQFVPGAFDENGLLNAPEIPENIVYADMTACSVLSDLDDQSDLVCRLELDLLPSYYIGDGIVTLRYNRETELFEVVSVRFEPFFPRPHEEFEPGKYSERREEVRIGGHVFFWRDE